MEAQEILQKGYTKHIKPFVGNSNLYTIEFWPKEPMQSRLPDGPKRVPPAPKAIVEVQGEDYTVKWEIVPSNPQVSLEDFTEEAKRAVADFRSNSQ